MSSRDRIYNASGHVYVIAFSNGTVKAGSTHTPKRRLAAHANAARAMGSAIVETWVSPPHVNFRENERALLVQLRQVAAATIAAEYFTGIAFVDAVRMATALEFTADSPELLAMRRVKANRVTRALAGAIWGADIADRIVADFDGAPEQAATATAASSGMETMSVPYRFPLLDASVVRAFVENGLVTIDVRPSDAAPYRARVGASQDAPCFAGATLDIAVSAAWGWGPHYTEETEAEAVAEGMLDVAEALASRPSVDVAGVYDTAVESIADVDLAVPDLDERRWPVLAAEAQRRESLA